MTFLEHNKNKSVQEFKKKIVNYFSLWQVECIDKNDYFCEQKLRFLNHHLVSQATEVIKTEHKLRA